jgi:DDE superfamily endonuclease
VQRWRHLHQSRRRIRRRLSAFANCADICTVYKAATTSDETHRTISIDEMPGIQTLERIAPGLPMKPGKVERRELEYRRHGTQTLIAAFDVATGKVEGVIGKTQTEKDFGRFFRGLLSRAAPRHKVGTSSATNLNIHLSESVVRLVARPPRSAPARAGRGDQVARSQ